MFARYEALLIACVCLILGGAGRRAQGSAEANVSGTWQMAVESPHGTAHPTIVLRQDGEKLTGTYKGRMGEAPVAGTLRSERIQFSVTLKFRDQPVTVKYSGTVQSDSMRGTAQFGDSGSGTWSARRKTS